MLVGLLVLGLLDLVVSQTGAVVPKHSFKPPYAARKWLCFVLLNASQWEILRSLTGTSQELVLSRTGSFSLLLTKPALLEPSGTKRCDKSLFGSLRVFSQAVAMTSWEVVLGFVIGKYTADLGADGLAFWYTKNRGSIGSSV